jgi:formylglycine-generating enzyme required for sulfatase activity
MKRIHAGLIIIATMAVVASMAYAAPNIDMVSVKGGCYQMGDTFGDGIADEKPVHEVCVDSFYLGKYVVTQAQWQAVMGKNPSSFNQCGGNCPVETVSWEDAQEFIRQLNAQTGKNYRLPYEAEWEYAARSGGKQEEWAGTSDMDELGAQAWFADNSGKTTHAVGTRKPNGLGLYDMTGNVWEWCKDWYDAEYYKKSPAKNPRGALSGSARVIRGGSWGDPAGGVRAAYRFGRLPFVRDAAIGFRLALPAVQ